MNPLNERGMAPAFVLFKDGFGHGKTAGWYIVFGGKSAEHEVSLQSAKNIVDAIDKSKFEVVLLGIDKQGQWHVNDASNYLLNAENPALIALNCS